MFIYLYWAKSLVSYPQPMCNDVMYLYWAKCFDCYPQAKCRLFHLFYLFILGQKFSLLSSSEVQLICLSIYTGPKNYIAFLNLSAVNLIIYL